jgi:hypothetical protein
MAKVGFDVVEFVNFQLVALQIKSQRSLLLNF